MRTSTQKAVRELLRANPDGLTRREMNATLHRTGPNLARVLKVMPDAYIDRWIVRTQYSMDAVWCVVVPPEDCPKPPTKRMESYR